LIGKERRRGEFSKQQLKVILIFLELPLQPPQEKLL
jgi:hypothetical protein